MKTKILFILFTLALCAPVSASFLWTLDYDSQFMQANVGLNTEQTSKPYLGGEASWLMDNGFGIGFAYNHLTIEDYEYYGGNARYVLVMPQLTLSYNMPIAEQEYFLRVVAAAGYGMGRYRLGVSDYRAAAPVYSGEAVIYRKLVGMFYGGVRIGYRYFVADYEVPEVSINISGLYAGVSLMHIYY